MALLRHVEICTANVQVLVTDDNHGVVSDYLLDWRGSNVQDGVGDTKVVQVRLDVVGEIGEVGAC